MNNIKYQFKKYPQFKERILICPECSENIWRNDIKDFSNCPFCMTALHFSNELEDYLLDPLVEIWIKSEENVLNKNSDKDIENEFPDFEMFSL
jgi:hypothetical protein